MTAVQQQQQQQMETLKRSGSSSSVEVPTVVSGIRTRSIKLGGASGGGSKGNVGAGVNNSLKMALMSLGSGGGAILQKELAVLPEEVVSAREKEKMMLQDLNDRFAKYIEKMRFLEADNKRLQEIVLSFEARFKELETTLQRLYEAELAGARRALDETTATKAAIELKVAGLEAKVAELTTLYDDEVAAHAETKVTLPKLEKTISEKDASIDFLTNNISTMEVELRRLKGQISTLQVDLGNSKMAADAEVVQRVELESLLTTKDDEIAFLTNMYEEKIKALLLVDLGSDSFASAFSNELALALRDIRAEYEAILDATRTTDTDSWYKAKFNELLTTSKRTGGDLQTAKAEVASARAGYQDAMSQLALLRAQLAAANEKILLLEADMAAAVAQADAERTESEKVIAELREALALNFAELKALTDHKLRLDAEIATYRRLLSGEETRVSAPLVAQSKSNTVTLTKAEQDFMTGIFNSAAQGGDTVSAKDLKEIFDYADKATFKARKPLGITEDKIASYLELCDVDPSGQLGVKQFVRLMMIARKDALRSLLLQFAGTKGYCTVEEASTALGAAGYDNVAQLVANADSNKDGRINWTEFIANIN